MVNNKWHHFGRWVESLLTCSVWLTFQNTRSSKQLGFNLITDSRVLSNDYFVLSEDLEKLNKFVEDKFLRDKGWFNKYCLVSDEKLNLLDSLISKKDINKFLLAVTECLNCAFTAIFLDHSIENYLTRIAADTGISFGEVLKHTKPYKETFIVKFQKELRTLKEKDIDKFIKKWAWMGTLGFDGNPLNEVKVEKELKNISKSKKEEEKESTVHLSKDYRDIIKICSKLSFYRTFLVENVTRAIFSYRPLLENFAVNNGIKYEDLVFLTYGEIIKLNNEKILPKNFKERKDDYGVVNENNVVLVVVGNKLKRYHRECERKIDVDITEIKGITAYSGKITGIVKIVEVAKEISKLKKGEVLVANETTPNYIIGMRIAGAIITNQGGITSHAAITSRELKIPCVIGTKIATKVLKDGDLVEVDANKGIVKILKKI